MSTPHKCPVCQGRGTVLSSFYGPESTAFNEVACRSCQGTGIVWSKDLAQDKPDPYSLYPPYPCPIIPDPYVGPVATKSSSEYMYNKEVKS